MRKLFVTLLFTLGAGLAHATPMSAVQDPWQKLNAKGEATPVEDGPWTCVLDKRTGLIWENKSDNHGWRYNISTYSWLDTETGQGVATSGSCEVKPGELTPCDTSTLIDIARKQAWCGRDDWRLPSAEELRGLIFNTGFIGDPMIAYGYFQHTGRSVYWSADHRITEKGKLEALGIRFSDASEVWLPPSRSLRIRLVAGARGK